MRAADPRIPRLKNSLHAVAPRHRHRPAGLEDDDGMWVRGRHRAYQRVLIVGQRKSARVEALVHRLIDEDDGYVCGFGEVSGG